MVSSYRYPGRQKIETEKNRKYQNQQKQHFTSPSTSPRTHSRGRNRKFSSFLLAPETFCIARGKERPAQSNKTGVRTLLFPLS